MCFLVDKGHDDGHASVCCLSPHVHTFRYIPTTNSMKKISEKVTFNLSKKIFSILALFVESPTHTYIQLILTKSELTTVHFHFSTMLGGLRPFTFLVYQNPSRFRESVLQGCSVRYAISKNIFESILAKSGFSILYFQRTDKYRKYKIRCK